MMEDGRLRQYDRNGYPVLAPTLRGRAEAEAWLAEHPELNRHVDGDSVEEPPGKLMPQAPNIPDFRNRFGSGAGGSLRNLPSRPTWS